MSKAKFNFIYYSLYLLQWIYCVVLANDWYKKKSGIFYGQGVVCIQIFLILIWHSIWYTDSAQVVVYVGHVANLEKQDKHSSFKL